MTVHESSFPNLSRGGYRITSPPNAAENCIAYAAERPGEWWDPAEDQFWPPGVPRDYKVETLVRVFEVVGYETCESSAHESGWQKVAIYGDEHEYTHAALHNADDGTWTSKLGPDEDISHSTPEDLAGGAYGSVLRMMKRIARLHR